MWCLKSHCTLRIGLIFCTRLSSNGSCQISPRTQRLPLQKELHQTESLFPLPAKHLFHDKARTSATPAGLGASLGSAHLWCHEAWLKHVETGWNYWYVTACCLQHSMHHDPSYFPTVNAPNCRAWKVVPGHTWVDSIDFVDSFGSKLSKAQLLVILKHWLLMTTGNDPYTEFPVHLTVTSWVAKWSNCESKLEIQRHCWMAGYHKY